MRGHIHVPSDPEPDDLKLLPGEQVVVGHYVESGFAEELRALLNRYSVENGSDTPDFILAAFLQGVLTDWEQAVRARDGWYGR